MSIAKKSVVAAEETLKLKENEHESMQRRGLSSKHVEAAVTAAAAALHRANADVVSAEAAAEFNSVQKRAEDVKKRRLNGFRGKRVSTRITKLRALSHLNESRPLKDAAGIAAFVAFAKTIKAWPPVDQSCDAEENRKHITVIPFP